MPRRKIPLALGLIIGVLGTLVGFYLVFLARQVAQTFWSFALYVVAWGCLIFFPHDLTHFVTGRLVGVRFQYYLIGKSPLSKLKVPVLSGAASRLPVLVIKVDPSSLRGASPGRRAVTFASGAIASMVLPFFPAVASFGHIDPVATTVLFALSISNAVLDAYLSPKVGDLHRAKPTSES